MLSRPICCRETHLRYLDKLKNTNLRMIEADMHLEEEFALSKKECKKILMYWMDSYNKRYNIQIGGFINGYIRRGCT